MSSHGHCVSRWSQVSDAAAARRSGTCAVSVLARHTCASRLKSNPLSKLLLWLLRAVSRSRKRHCVVVKNQGFSRHYTVIQNEFKKVYVHFGLFIFNSHMNRSHSVVPTIPRLYPHCPHHDSRIYRVAALVFLFLLIPVRVLCYQSSRHKCVHLAGRLENVWPPR